MQLGSAIRPLFAESVSNTVIVFKLLRNAYTEKCDHFLIKSVVQAIKSLSAYVVQALSH